MYGQADASTRQVSAATGANATTPMTSIIAVAASGSRVRPPSRTLPVPWSHAAAKASRNAETGTARPYLARSRGLVAAAGHPRKRGGEPQHGHQREQDGGSLRDHCALLRTVPSAARASRARTRPVIMS